jgi:hypothetical protein
MLFLASLVFAHQIFVKVEIWLSLRGCWHIFRRCATFLIRQNICQLHLETIFGVSCNVFAVQFKLLHSNLRKDIAADMAVPTDFLYDSDAKPVARNLLKQKTPDCHSVKIRLC